MERIGSLINKLKEQFEQNADPTQMLVTVQLLQNELAQSQGSRTLGTSKVAVVLPSASHVIPSYYERYAPKPAEKPPVHEVKEKVLVDQGSVSVVQRNGQLDMVFDPMTEIPTLSHQSTEKETGKERKDNRQKEVNENNTDHPESLNDKLKQGKTELMEVLKETPVKDLRKAIGINDRYVFINDLFRGDESMYERSIKTINSFNIFPEAEYWITRELKLKLGWDNESGSVKHFDQLVKRRFS